MPCRLLRSTPSFTWQTPRDALQYILGQSSIVGVMGHCQTLQRLASVYIHAQHNMVACRCTRVVQAMAVRSMHWLIGQHMVVHYVCQCIIGPPRCYSIEGADLIGCVPPRHRDGSLRRRLRQRLWQRRRRRGHPHHHGGDAQGTTLTCSSCSSAHEWVCIVHEGLHSHPWF